MDKFIPGDLWTRLCFLIQVTANHKRPCCSYKIHSNIYMLFCMKIWTFGIRSIMFPVHIVQTDKNVCNFQLPSLFGLKNGQFKKRDWKKKKSLFRGLQGSINTTQTVVKVFKGVKIWCLFLRIKRHKLGLCQLNALFCCTHPSNITKTLVFSMTNSAFLTDL